jgi:agmatinase
MPQARPEAYIAQGGAPFFRLPCAAPGELPARTRAALLGVPTDAGATYQPGARLAPWHVRRVSALVQGHHVLHGVDVFEATAAVDAGNVVFPPFDRAIMRAAVEAQVGLVIDAGAVPFLVGGDHSIAFPALRAAAARHGPLAVVHVDAHLDTSGAEAWGDDWHHGTPIRHALEEGLIAPGALSQVGIRGPWGSAADGEVGDRHGATRIDPDAVARRGAEEVGRAITRAIGDRPTWITFDVDAVDPAFAPGTGTPVPGGLTSREALALLRALAGVRLVGMDVVEVCPALDHADLTSHLAAHLLHEGLGLAAVAPGLRR